MLYLIQMFDNFRVDIVNNSPDGKPGLLSMVAAYLVIVITFVTILNITWNYIDWSGFLIAITYPAIGLALLFITNKYIIRQSRLTLFICLALYLCAESAIGYSWGLSYGFLWPVEYLNNQVIITGAIVLLPVYVFSVYSGWFITRNNISYPPEFSKKVFVHDLITVVLVITLVCLVQYILK